MYGLITRLTAASGKRDEMIAILKEGAADMPGCLGYVIARDSADENDIWITEVWESITKHHASLELPSVRNAMSRAKTLIAGFNRVAATEPVWSGGDLTRR